MQRKGNLFVLSGPSGAGKGTLVKRVLERVPDAWLSVSDTTRSPREGEIDGVHYFFVDDAEFDQLVETGGFLEWARVHENRYGTPRARVEEHMAKGGQVLLEIDVQGGFQIREQIPEAHLVFIEPPSLEVLDALDAALAAACDAGLAHVTRSLLATRLRYRPDDVLMGVLRSFGEPA